MAGQAVARLPRSQPAMFYAVWTFSAIIGWGLALVSGRWMAQNWSALGDQARAAIVLMAILVAIAELRPIMIGRFETLSVAPAFVFATMYVWGWEPAVVLMAASVLLSELLDRKPLWKVVFNVGQYSICVAVAALVLRFSGMHSTGIGEGMKATDLGPETLIAVLLSWTVYHLLNLALVAGLAGPDETWWESFTDHFWYYTTSTFAVLALSPLVAVVAAAGGEDGRTWLLLPLLLVPLIGVQHSAQLSQEREHRALHDPLTGLPNRLLLTDRIDTALSRSTRSGGRVVVIFLDLDLFKTINDGLGHAVGDSVLVDVANRLKAIMRPGDTLARFSGDEFAMVCESIPDYEIEVLAAQIQDALQPAFSFESHEVTVTASIGVATATPYSTAESLLREADSAMYRAKTAGRDQVAHFHWSMHQAAAARLDDQLGLHRALERGELRAHYQPVIHLTTGQVLGMEALIRWEHPQRGLLSPDQFIPLAEETGLIVPIGSWMLDHSLAQLRQWRQEVVGAGDLWMAVNLSARQLSDPDLAHKITRSVRESGLPPDSLHLEITETAVMRSADRAAATLQALQSLGVRLIIDDFGTGYSSLARLKRLPVSALKVDRTFVDGLGTDSSDLSIVDAIVNMARSLNLDIIAEGVETREQLEILHTLGADMGQGYLWSRPMPAADIVGWVGESMSAADLARFRALLRRG